MMKLHRPLIAVAAIVATTACAPAADRADAGDAPVSTPTEGTLPGPQTEIGQLAAGQQCQEPRYCGDVGYVDCGAAYDGPAYYFDRDEGTVLGHCGGACMIRGAECQTSCPPPEWTCG